MSKSGVRVVRMGDLIEFSIDSDTKELVVLPKNEEKLREAGLEISASEYSDKVSFYDGEGTLTIEIRDLTDGIVLVEYIDPYVFIGLYARYKDIEDMEVGVYDNGLITFVPDMIKKRAHFVYEPEH